MAMDDVEIVAGGFAGRGERRYEIVGGRLKCGYGPTGKFEFIRGHTYRVLHLNPATTLHKDAVGIYLSARRTKSGWIARLDCMGKTFWINPLALVPWKGRITERHQELISPIRGRVHLLQNGRCACRCDSRPDIRPTLLGIDDFVTVAENSRCKNCNSIAKRLDCVDA
jgi:hypothetical protein